MEVQEKTREQVILERKLQQIVDPRSIVVIISNSSLPKEIAFKIFDFDRAVLTITRNVGFTLTLNDAKKYIEEAKKIVNSVWNKVGQIVPGLLTISPENWQEFNDTYEIKQKQAYRRNSLVFIPRTNEGAQLMMAFKILGRKRIDLAATGNLELIEKIAIIYREFLDSAQKFIDSVNQALIKEK